MARAFLIMEALEEQERSHRRRETARVPRSLRNRANIHELTDVQFRRQYRLSRELFLELCSELRPLLCTTRTTRISIECKVLITLSFFATGSHQKPFGASYLHALSQSSVSKVIIEVTNAMNNKGILMKYIRFPQTHTERVLIISRYFNKFGFPGVLGCIDCTHVAMVRPTDDEERFFNHKHYYSRNVQIICDSDLNILNVDATFGGASHDAYIWGRSEIKSHMQQLHQTGEHIWFLGDSGYPLRPWLLTPIMTTEPSSAEEYYNTMQCQTRNTVKRCIEVLKARWRCLLSHRVLHYDHNTVAKIINACCVLHNMANMRRLPVPELSDEDVHLNSVLQTNDKLDGTDKSQHLEHGRHQRNIIVQRLWKSRQN